MSGTDDTPSDEGSTEVPLDADGNPLPPIGAIADAESAMFLRQLAREEEQGIDDPLSPEARARRIQSLQETPGYGSSGLGNAARHIGSFAIEEAFGVVGALGGRSGRDIAAETRSRQFAEDQADASRLAAHKRAMFDSIGDEPPAPAENRLPEGDKPDPRAQWDEVRNAWVIWDAEIGDWSEIG